MRAFCIGGPNDGKAIELPPLHWRKKVMIPFRNDPEPRVVSGDPVYAPTPVFAYVPRQVALRQGDRRIIGTAWLLVADGVTMTDSDIPFNRIVETGCVEWA